MLFMPSLRRFSMGVVPALWIGCTPGCYDATFLCPDAYYEKTANDPQVRLPLDESPHCFGGGEWWYYTGRLKTTDERAFGIEAVVFHVPRLPLARFAEFWVAHYAVLNEATGEFFYDQTRTAELGSTSAAAYEGFDVTTPLVQMRGSGGRDELHAVMENGRFGLDLMLTDTRGAVLHNGNGYAPFGHGESAFYYSRPRMTAMGALEIDGETTAVSGQFWFDRQWGMSINDPFNEWDWFSIRLDDGIDIMLYAFPASGGGLALGTYIPSMGEERALSAEDFVITPTASWRSPHTGVLYDVAWTIELPHEALTLIITAVAEDQELDTRETTLNIYWEGLCVVGGYRGAETVTGHAYVEQANAGRPTVTASAP